MRILINDPNLRIAVWKGIHVGHIEQEPLVNDLISEVLNKPLVPGEHPDVTWRIRRAGMYPLEGQGSIMGGDLYITHVRHNDFPYPENMSVPR